MPELNGIMGSLSPSAADPRPKEDPVKIADAARQFEALLIVELLRSARGSSEGWLGAGEDPSASSAVGLAEERLAASLADQGGLGLAGLIVSGLTRSNSETRAATAPRTSPPGSAVQRR